MKEAVLLARTRTFGPVLEKKGFTADEATVLKYFFTNIDKNIYAATDAMPNALWALLEGGYSRSKLSMRMRFLQIFEDMQKEADLGKIEVEQVVTIKDFANQIRSGNKLNLSFFLEKAETFMRKWAVQYGHDSLKDSDIVRFAIENITQWATNPIEHARLGAYQEKSTRYVGFDRDSLVVPTDLKKFEKEIRQWNELLIHHYEISEDIVKEFFAQQLSDVDFKSDAAKQRTINAKTYDVIRYFLPATMLTSLGVVWPTREAERHISWMLSSPQAELRSVGQALYEEGKKVSPGLLSHVKANEFQQKRRKSALALHQKLSLVAPQETTKREDDAVRLLSITKHIEEKIAAAILFEEAAQGHTYAQLLAHCLTDREFTKEVISTYLEQRGNFDALPMNTEVGSLLFQVTMDYGGYRDLQRHRRNLILPAPLTALAGFEYPEFVGTAPQLQEVKAYFDLCAQQTKELHQKILKEHPALAGYVTMFANKQHYVWQMDPRQLAYVVELRTTPAGHHSYREICQRLYALAKPHLPHLSSFIRVDMSLGEEGRKKQEERTVEKLKALGADELKTT